MRTLRLILKELFGLFVDDGSLAVALLVLVAFATGLRQFEQIPDTVTAIVLVAGALLILIENVLRRARRHVARKRFTAVTTAVILLPVVGMGGWAGGIQIFDNFHVVEPGALYRSAQMDGTELTKTIQSYGIRTVLNLRGENTGKDWYDAEIAAATAAGVEHVDIPMSAREEPDETKLQRLMTILRTAPQPILVHCQSGSDRTGLASALYELDVMVKPKAEAEEQLSFFYGHFPWLGSRTVAMDRTFEQVAAARGGETP